MPTHNSSGVRRQPTPPVGRRRTPTTIGSNQDEQLSEYDKQHAAIAQRLGVRPLTVQQRAAAMLAKACNGWRRNGVCESSGGPSAPTAHRACVWAQYHHDVVLLDHAQLGPEIGIGGYNTGDLIG